MSSEGSERIRELEEMAEEEPDDELTQFMLGKAYLDGGRAEEAAERLRRAVELRPSHTAAHRFLGNALEKAGRLEEAREAYERGLVVSEETRDYQTGKEIKVFLDRVRGRLAE
ncbi:MAG: tetratricopeptide repeat protein [bacterium]